MPWSRSVFSAALALLLSAVQAWAAAPAVITPGQPMLDLAPHLSWHHEPEAHAGAVTLFARAAAGEFQPLPNGRTNFGFRSGAFWFHTRIENRDPGETRWLLVQRYPLSDRIEVWLRRADGTIDYQASGDHLPFSHRAIKYRHPNFWLELAPGEPVELLVRVESQSSMQVPLALYSPAAFAELARDAQFSIGLYYGILLALFFYNLILWATLRDPTYFWYMFHITAFGLVLFCLNGLAFEYLWPNSPWLQDRCVPVSICIAQIGMQQFARIFLELDQRWPTGSRIGLALIVLFAVLGVASLLLPYRITTPIASAAVLPSVAWIVIVSIVALRRGYAPARLFLLAWALFLIGTATFALVAFGVLPKLFITEYGVQIGSALEMILLSFALAYRYGALRNENERIVREANEQLERSVATRTAELSQALEQLAEANARLRELNRRDNLTGVFSRRHFRETLEHLLVDMHETGASLAVLMIDIDHFKSINDELGHFTGDACLRWIAGQLQVALGSQRGVLGRFGGEEFIAALPDTSLAQARRIAEQLQEDIASTPVQIGDETIRLTISIGLHVIPAGTRTGSEEAIRRADDALYLAKRDGRNCVRDSTALPAATD
ncbi:MAG: 7TM diverse intracellular signaling domain-containing protein [Rehaibacterium terrae]|uniref:sensor domain-containing diguanylate cyclase n=1 Tax=Rehaibacterium terrae TaxID=1341696 RepID=UPI00391D1676